MAKKNSTKTATKEAMQSSEPRVMTIKGWTGISVEQTPYDTEVSDFHLDKNNYAGKGQSDSQPNFLAVQNNLVTCGNGSIETRYEPIKLNDAPTMIDEETGEEKTFALTGVSLCFDNYIYAIAYNNEGEKLFRVKLPTFTNAAPHSPDKPWELNKWENIPIVDKNGLDAKLRTFTDISVFKSSLLVLAKWNDEHGELYNGSLDTITTEGISNAVYIPDPQDVEDSYSELHPTKQGMQGEGRVARLQFRAVWINKYGTTRETKELDSNIIYTPLSPLEFTSSKYVSLSGSVPANKDVVAVDIYCSMNDSVDSIFCGRANIEAGTNTWTYNWLGSMADITQWTMSSLKIPKDNTTRGPDATYMDQYDGRLYFYGGSTPYRLYIGGNPGNELSVALGLGGAFVDIEEGSGQEIRKVLKFKGYNGASLVTVLTYHPNTTKSARYDLVENNITVTNEYAATGYQAERVEGAIGCSSFYGADTFLDGLYAINRYGLTITTKVMENQNNIQAKYVSDPIKPLFTSMLGVSVEESRLLCIGDNIYMMLAAPTSGVSSNDQRLEDYLFVYDTQAKSWFTYDLSKDFANALESENKNMIHIDSKNFWEGIGVIKSDYIALIPATGADYEYYYDKEGKPYDGHPAVSGSLHTHELASTIPIKGIMNLHTLEIYFDYLCCPEGLDIWVEGVDYYGRTFKIDKTVYEPVMRRKTTHYIRVDKNIESFRLFIQGKAHYRLTHFNMKLFIKANRVGTRFGIDARDLYKGHHETIGTTHHKIQNYNSIRDSLLA